MKKKTNHQATKGPVLLCIKILLEVNLLTESI